MKKIYHYIICIGISTSLLLTSCSKGCICRYYDEQGNLVETENWENSEISESECFKMDGQTDVSVRIDNNNVVNCRVSCTTGTSIW